MGEREVDQRLVERVQRGDKKAFELLVTKYQRKLNRLLSRFIRDPSEVPFIAAQRADIVARVTSEVPVFMLTSCGYGCIWSRRSILTVNQCHGLPPGDRVTSRARLATGSLSLEPPSPTLARRPCPVCGKPADKQISSFFMGGSTTPDRGGNCGNPGFG